MAREVLEFDGDDGDGYIPIEVSYEGAEEDASASGRAKQRIKFAIQCLIFLFEWVFATMSGVGFASMFTLSFPQYTGEWKPLTIYACFALMVFPGVGYLLSRWLRSTKEEVESTSQATLHPTGGTALILISAFSMALSASINSSSKAITTAIDNGSGGPFGAMLFALAVALIVTAIAVMFQVMGAHYLRVLQTKNKSNGIQSTYTSTFTACFFSAIGWQWKRVWEYLVRGIVGPPGLQALAVQAAITLLLGFPLLRWVVPHSDPGPEASTLRRRVVMTAHLTVISVMSVEVTNFFYGMASVAVVDWTGSDVIGEVVAYAWAFVAFAIAVFVAKCTPGGWTPHTAFGKSVGKLMGYIVCYAIWYPWAADLDEWDGFGLTTNNLCPPPHDDSGSGSGSGVPQGPSPSPMQPPPLYLAEAAALARPTQFPVPMDDSGDGLGLGSVFGSGLGSGSGFNLVAEENQDCKRHGLTPTTLSFIRLSVALAFGLGSAIVLSKLFAVLLRVIGRRLARHYHVPADVSLNTTGSEDAEPAATSGSLVKRLLHDMPSVVSIALWEASGD